MLIEDGEVAVTNERSASFEAFAFEIQGENPFQNCGENFRQLGLEPRNCQGRGRDGSHEPPPAQIRTSASTHPAPLKDQGVRQTKLQFAQRAPPGTGTC
jgi:hypothetical protein